MGHSVTLGGDRLGSGNKNKTYLHNYERSTHDLSTDFLSSMGCGMLIPFMCELVTRDDKYEIDLNAGLRTVPTQGPMFGSFKLQVDVFKYPLRLCQALLHNNPLAIGLKANQVKFPKMRLWGNVGNDMTKYTTLMAANNSLVKYLQISGMGTAKGNENGFVWRDMFAAGLIGYYDIFKNYYANKQEKYAYTLSRSIVDSNEQIKYEYVNTEVNVSGLKRQTTIWDTVRIDAEELNQYQGDTWYESLAEQEITLASTGTGNLTFNLRLNTYKQLSLEEFSNTKLHLVYKAPSGSLQPSVKVGTIKELYEEGVVTFYDNFKATKVGENYTYDLTIMCTYRISGRILWDFGIYDTFRKIEDTILKPFELENIDKMRYDILSFHQLGQSFILDSNEELLDPYYSALGDYEDEYWRKPLSGICVKTYQSDLFNNWLNTEIIDGENGIAEITSIATTQGSITIDQIQFAEKLYNLLNRIAVSGGTYEDYLDAAYTQSAKRFEESPMWVGGLSDEIIFEEIIQTAPTEGDPLGTMGGRGNLMGKTKGGKITVKIDEPALLIGIVSITPRIVYTQGNTWYNTEIDSLQDIHVPALDAIGFQNLVGEEMHAGSTIINADGTIETRPIIGKVPAWIHYMTNVDRAYGDFAAGGGEGYMVLNRDYEIKNGVLQDATTYIDPAKFNYAFAYTKRDAQNFWVKIKADIKARRLMSAKQIPTA